MGELAVVIRPNGRIYHAKKLPVAHLVEEDDWRHDRTFVYVLRTHDEGRARELAMRLRTVYPVPVEIGWYREGIRAGERTIVRDEMRGVPCVVFQVDD